MKNDEKPLLERFHKTENDPLFIKRYDSENINIQHTCPVEKKTFENITKGKFLCLAPMVNNSSRPYRFLARSLGANLVYTEMINCESYLRGQNRKSLLDSFPITESLRSSISDRFNSFYDHCNSKVIYDLIVQICGNSLPAILKCVDSILNETSSRIFSIDLNLGCPQKIAKKGNYGAFLAEDTKLTYRLVSSIAEYLNKKGVRLTCKIRLKETDKETLEYVKCLQACGVSMIVVHGRTIKQRGSDTGLANWTIIKKIKQLLSIPVIANGNIVAKKDIINLLKYTECDGVMVAESHLYDPLIFYTESCSSNNKYVYYINQQDCLKLIKNNGIYGLLKVYIDLAKECKEENEIRSHLFKITHKFAEHNFKFFEDLNKCRGIEGYENLIEKYKEVLVKEECTVKIRGVYTDTSFLMLQ